jgi:hypothetical protein
MNKTLSLLLLLFAINVSAQKSMPYKSKKGNGSTNPMAIATFELTADGDTINRVLNNGSRHGFWIIKTDATLGEDALIKTGTYNNNLKTGKWNTYTNGLLSVSETYANDVRDGEVRYYEEGAITIRGQYKANKIPAKDTIAVMQLTQIDTLMELQNTTRSFKDGIWIFYKPNGKIAYKEYYYLDDLVQTQNMENGDVADPDYVAERNILFPHSGGRTVDPFAKINKGRSPARYTDFPEDGKGVVPNKRKSKK